jgi:hypothetical protein
MFPYFSPAIAQQQPSFVCADLCIYFFAGVAFSCTWTFLACTSAVEGLRIWSRNRPYPTVRNSEVIIDVNRVSRDTFENHFFSSLSREPGACAFKNRSAMHSARSSTRMADGKVEFRRVDQIFRCYQARASLFLLLFLFGFCGGTGGIRRDHWGSNRSSWISRFRPFGLAPIHENVSIRKRNFQWNFSRPV